MRYQPVKTEKFGIKARPEGYFERKQGLERKLTKGHFKEDASSLSSMRFRVLLLARINVQA